MLKLWSRSKVILSCYFLGYVGLQTGVVEAYPIRVSEAPDNNLALTLSAIESARDSLQINIYEMTSPEIMAAIQEKIEAGIRVVILEEGQPVGGLSKESRRVQGELVRAMQNKRSSQNHFYEMTSKASDQKRRFRFNHAKYIVTDGKTLLLGSENYSSSGNPTSGRIGNRGWEVFIQDRNMINEYQAIFHSDLDRSYGDLIDLTESESQEFFLEDSPLARAFLEELSSLNPFSEELPKVTVAKARAGKGHALSGKSSRKALGEAPTDLDASSFQKITSPETSLSGLTAMIENAQSSIDLELMSFNSRWSNQDEANPLFQALVSAARRGVQIRVLLNDEWVFARGGGRGGKEGDKKPADSEDFWFEQKDGDSSTAAKAKKKQNEVTAGLFNRIGSDEGLKLTARIANVKKMGITYIHNKGALVDDNKTLVSSINWNQNSTTNNREAALLINSEAVNAHYKALFEQDWAASE